MFIKNCLCFGYARVDKDGRRRQSRSQFHFVYIMMPLDVTPFRNLNQQNGLNSRKKEVQTIVVNYHCLGQPRNVIKLLELVSCA